MQKLLCAQQLSFEEKNTRKPPPAGSGDDGRGVLVRHQGGAGLICVAPFHPDTDSGTGAVTAHLRDEKAEKS